MTLNVLEFELDGLSFDFLKMEVIDDKYLLENISLNNLLFDNSKKDIYTVLSIRDWFLTSVSGITINIETEEDILKDDKNFDISLDETILLFDKKISFNKKPLSVGERYHTKNALENSFVNILNLLDSLFNEFILDFSIKPTKEETDSIINKKIELVQSFISTSFFIKAKLEKELGIKLFSLEESELKQLVPLFPIEMSISKIINSLTFLMKDFQYELLYNIK
jgi:hypothetical protein